MLKFQIATKQDRHEAAVIEQRRRTEEERKSRIFNARNRILGVDCKALEKQIVEKNAIKQSEREHDDRYTIEEGRRNVILQRKNDELNKERRRIETEIIDYRNKYQRKEFSREFDLNDPKHILKSLPARIGKDDPRLGISSAQQFVGEDLMSLERKRAQQEQQKSWLVQQMNERRQAEEYKAKADRHAQNAMASRDKTALHLDTLQREHRNQTHSSIMEYNRALAAEQRARKLKTNTNEQEDNLAEIYNNLTSDLLTENPELANSTLGKNRIIAANYKGMNDVELAGIRKKQQHQIAEEKKKSHDEQNINKKWEKLDKNFSQIILSKENDVNQEKRVIKKELQNENLQLAAQHNAKIDHINNILYTNPPTKEYFDKFNTTSR